MGSACCVAARDRTIRDRSGTSDVVGRNDRYSPSWSFRWDNRGRVAGEESSINSFSHLVTTNDRLLDNKSHTTVEEGSPLNSSRSLTWQNEEIRFHQSGPLNSKNLPNEKESISPTKTSTPGHSTSSMSASPLSSSHHLPPLSTLTPPRWARHNHHHHLRQVSDSRIRGIMSPNFSISEDGSPSPFTHHNNKSTRGSHGGSSDLSSETPTYSDLMAMYNNSKRWSFDSESLSLSRERVSVSVQPCGVCAKNLTERSCFAAQKLGAVNGLPVVAVLVCGHVYHAECLENMTRDVDKYDPACPVCTFGEKKVFKLSEKARGDKIGKLRRRVVDGGGGDSVLFEKSSSSSGKPFLRRHFSFGYNKPNRNFLDNNGSRKKRFFWSKSTKE